MRFYDRFIRNALTKPHDPIERRDPEFIVYMRCEDCGQLGHGPRSQIDLAIREHREHCPSLNRLTEKPHMTRLLFPRM